MFKRERKLYGYIKNNKIVLNFNFNIDTVLGTNLCIICVLYYSSREMLAVDIFSYIYRQQKLICRLRHFFFIVFKNVKLFYDYYSTAMKSNNWFSIYIYYRNIVLGEQYETETLKIYNILFFKSIEKRLVRFEKQNIYILILQLMYCHIIFRR